MANRWRTIWLYTASGLSGAVLYSGLCFWFVLEAWGRRGEVKPEWFIWLYRVTQPGMSFPGASLLLGAGVGLGLLAGVQGLRRLPPRSP
ncbi:MAG: hypothetical protein OHK0012_25820 [Synechococcales cyanobacterium]